MKIAQHLKNLLIVLLICRHAAAFPVTRGKEYRPPNVASGKDGAVGEPSCEELKAMWRFSKRQSRAAEITNEIPTYRDPFAHNVWESYHARSRSIGGMPLVARYGGRPVYGRLVHKAPIFRIQDTAGKHKAFEEVAKMYGNLQSGVEPRRRVTAFRLSGGMPAMRVAHQSGSFQHLKELIKTERARELQEQRNAEEAAARAAALKVLSGSVKSQSNLQDLNYNYESDSKEMRDQENVIGRGGVLVFPDLLAPAANPEIEESAYLPDDSYVNDNSKPQTPPTDDENLFNDDFDGFLY